MRSCQLRLPEDVCGLRLLDTQIKGISRSLGFVFYEQSSLNTPPRAIFVATLYLMLNDGDEELYRVEWSRLIDNYFSIDSCTTSSLCALAIYLTVSNTLHHVKYPLMLYFLSFRKLFFFHIPCALLIANIFLYHEASFLGCCEQLYDCSILSRLNTILRRQTEMHFIISDFFSAVQSFVSAGGPYSKNVIYCLACS